MLDHIIIIYSFFISYIPFSLNIWWTFSHIFFSIFFLPQFYCWHSISSYSCSILFLNLCCWTVKFKIFMPLLVCNQCPSRQHLPTSPVISFGKIKWAVHHNILCIRFRKGWPLYHSSPEPEFLRHRPWNLKIPWKLSGRGVSLPPGSLATFPMPHTQRHMLLSSSGFLILSAVDSLG